MLINLRKVLFNSELCSLLNEIYVYVYMYVCKPGSVR